eukprot:TRINITY_DN14553_c0_g1_i1.p1 TRINITY_DN14553_c0_g1~~TRINITY_DN14553_c0_g1_i1.p1  ORF type:complete len:219 (+),score=55.32 TRINITY_DN14553_c0_g1_i1:29-685(+)
MNFKFIFLLGVLPIALATLGIDISSKFSTTQWQCARKAGYEFAIVRGYRSTASIDPNLGQSVAQAWQAGFKHVDVYFFPAAQKKSAYAQVNEFIAYLVNTKVKFGMVWVDVEVAPKCWYDDFKKNQQFMDQVIAALEENKVHFGIYTSKYMHGKIFGDSWTGTAQRPFKKYDLWYAGYNNKPDFSNFHPFGGWTKPAIHQYAGSTNICNGMVVDLNYY